MGRDWDDVDLRDAGTIADALSRQPLVRTLFSQYPNIAKVPFCDSPRVGLGAVAGSLDRIAYNLLFLIKLHGNMLTRDKAIAAAPDLEAHWLDRAAADLIVTGLALRLETGELSLFDDVADRVALPVPSFGDRAEHITSDRLARAASRAGLTGVGARKAERVAAISALLADADQVRRALQRLSAEAQKVFDLLWQRTVARTRSDTMVNGAHRTFEFVPDELRRLVYSGGGGPVRELSEAMLIGSDYSGFEVWIWAETAAALGMSLTPDWTPPAMPNLVTLDPEGPDAIVDTLHALDAVVGATSVSPPQGNKTGERRPPVKYWRSVAKSTGLDAELCVRCGNLAIDLGLLVPDVGPTTGRGRNATFDCFWRPAPTRVAEFTAQSAPRRWAAVVERWLTSETDSSDGASQRRIMLLAALEHLPEGFGIPASEVSAYIDVRHSRLGMADPIDDDLADLVRLGVLSTGSAIGLTSAGRAVCQSLDQLDELFDQGEVPSVVIQADHTVITPAGASIDLILGMRRVADPVSSGSVGVWRLSADRIARATTDGFDAVGFVRALSPAELPSGVERFLTDSARAESSIVIRPVGCVITSTDHVALSDAARHKAAKLEVVAPGVAVSPLTEAKVAEVLRGKGVVLGGVPTAKASDRKPAPSWVIPHVGIEEKLPAVSPLLWGNDPAGSPDALVNGMIERLGKGER